MGVPEPISIHAPLAGCDFNLVTDCHSFFISIHAPLAGCDQYTRDFSPMQGDFNPRTPCGVRPGRPPSGQRSRWYFNPRTPYGVRLREQNFLRFLVSFQSTHPSRGATCGSFAASPPCLDFNPRTPLAGCDNRERIRLYGVFGISIHAPLAGCPFFPGGIPTHRRRRTHPVSGKKCAYPG